MKINSFLTLLFTALLLAACGRAKGVLPEDEMVDLMVDMELAEAYVNTEMGGSNRERIEMGRKVLAAHGVSEESLDTTLAWYGRNMDKYAQLFNKVDREIEIRRKHYKALEGTTVKESGNLWLLNPHVVISPLSGFDAFSFTLPNPETDKGDILIWSMNLPNQASVKGTLGVEYSDGSGEANVVNTSSKNHVEIAFYSDSARTISRIFGTLHFKDEVKKPIYIDSIMIKTESIDTLNYRSKRRAQKIFGALAFKPKEELKKDSLPEPESLLDIEKTVMSDTVKNINTDTVAKAINPALQNTPRLPDGRKAPKTGAQGFEKLKKNS